LATLQIMERTGVAFDCQEAIDILGEAGAEVSNPKRVKIPSYLVEQALRTAPKTITLYTREGESAIVLNGMTGSHFGAVVDCPNFLDPYTPERRQCYVKDIADTYQDIVTLNKNQVLVVSPIDSEVSAGLITQWVQDRISTELDLQPMVSFQEYLLSNEVVCADVLNNVSS